mgnify:CR=1 FL=1
MSRRVALAGFLHETNTFAPTKARMSDFVQGGGYMPMARGQAVIDQSRGINLGIGGAVEFGESAGWDMVPVLWAGAIPSAHVSRDAYESITEEIISGTHAAGPLGGIFLVWLVGQPQSMPVYIGVLLLLGIVSKNSILLIDFAIEAMAHGQDKMDAIIDAGHKRAQPIVMTTFAMTAGMIPTALSGVLGSGDGAWRAPMGTMVIGGLVVSTLLTLLIVPAGFSLADGFEKRVGPWLRDRLLSYRPGDDTDGRYRGDGEQESAPAE